MNYFNFKIIYLIIQTILKFPKEWFVLVLTFLHNLSLITFVVFFFFFVILEFIFSIIF